MIDASDILLTVTEARMGSRVLVTFQKNHPNAIHTLVITLQGNEVGRIENLGSSLIWEVPDYTRACNDRKNAECILKCRTYLYGEYQGERLAVLTLLLPEPVKFTGTRLTAGRETALQYTRPAENFTMDMALILEGYTFAIATKYGEDSLLWTPPYTLAKEIPTLTETGAQLRCTTWNGTARVGTTETQVILEIPENAETRPRLHSVTLSPMANGLPEPFGSLYIHSKTGLKAQVDAESLYSELDYISLRIGAREVRGSQPEVTLLDTSGTVPVTVTAVDRRGFSTSYEETIEIYPYQKPRILPAAGSADVICERATERGQLSPAGTCLAIRAGRRFTEILRDGAALNRCRLRFRVKKTEDTVFGPWQTLMTEENPRQEISVLLAGVVSDPKSSYRIELSALDSLGEEHRMGFSVMTEAISFVLYDGVDGAAFGKYPEEPHVVDLAPHMTLRVRGRLEVLGETWRDLGLSSAVQPSAYPHGRCENTGCFYRVSGGNRVCVSFNCGIHYENQPLTVGRNLIPESLRPGRPVSAFCPAEGGTALVTVTPAGTVLVEALTGTAYAGWIDGYVEYFL